MGKRERAHQVAEAEAAPTANETFAEREPGIVPGLTRAGYGEPDGVRPPNADRVLAQLRDLLGPLLTALDADGADPVPRTVSAPRYDAEEAW